MRLTPGRAIAANITPWTGRPSRRRHPILHSANNMANLIVNYDGSITTSPQQLVFPQTVQEIQSILKDSATYLSPVRAKGSYHSLTPCASSTGTILDMTHMTQVIEIDTVNNTLTPRAGIQGMD